MAKEHHYSTQLNWTGNRGDGTTDYRAYDRDHVLVAGGKPEIPVRPIPISAVTRIATIPKNYW